MPAWSGLLCSHPSSPPPLARRIMMVGVVAASSKQPRSTGAAYRTRKACSSRRTRPTLVDNATVLVVEERLAFECRGCDGGPATTASLLRQRSLCVACCCRYQQQPAAIFFFFPATI